ncbi:hypothetical protein V6N12_042887 [Hibiscus sabdariffa]|uniref:Uncharacterized protein n=1 Tax=Hibiscus sabdariffa TaxID=183260 RepID=A0ABR2BFA6_9ROSI
MAEGGATGNGNNKNSVSGNDKDTNETTRKKVSSKDPEVFCCVLQPSASDSGNEEYIGIRRILLARKAESGCYRRLDWRCNGKGYVAYRNYMRRPRNWEKFQAPCRTSNTGNSGRWLSSSSSFSHLFELENWTNSSKDKGSGTAASNQRTSIGSRMSDSDRPRQPGLEPAYSFVGMHCIFDQCEAAVTVLKFGHMSSDLLAYGASDGTLVVCNVSDPPSVTKQLSGHSKDVTDFDFSSNNQYIASSSKDKTVRVWDISRGVCIRVIYGVSPQLCIRFHPVNNNFLSVGNANKEITVFNFSTGRVITKSNFDSEVTAMDHDPAGQLVFCGDAQYRSFSLMAKGPVLLTCTQDGIILFFSVSLESQGYLTLRCSLKLSSRVHSVRASFCPLLSLEEGEYIVVGSEDSNVDFYDLTRPKHHTCVNKLQGHSFPVIGVAWNHGENLLASSDLSGLVIVWKRAKT